MTFKRLLCKLLCLIVMSVSLPVMASNWKLHPSFDKNPLRIIDTPGNTYFLVHQQYYQKKCNGYYFPSLTLFEYDKAKPAEGIRPLVTKANLSEADMRLADYSITGDYLFVAYNSGVIDLVTPDGGVSSIDILKKSNVPGGAIINSVTFDVKTGDAWVATDAGYLHLDAASKSVLNKATLNKSVKWIAQAGEGLVAIIDGVLYHCNSLAPRSFEDFTPVPDSASPLALMPLSEMEFAYLSGTKGGNVSVVLAKKKDNGWNLQNLGSDKFHSLTDAFITAHNYEPNILPNRDGYMLYSASKVWQLKRGQEGGETALYSIPYEGMTAPLGSWDMTDFWCYKDRGKFQQHHALYSELAAQTSASWSATGEPLRPDAPAAFISAFMNYSPTHGMLVMNHGQTRDLANDSPASPVLLSGNNGGKWRLYSQAYEAPYSVENDPALERVYKNQINRFPLPDPQGIGVDPLYPNRVSFGSMWGGMAIMDLDDIKKDVMHFAAPNDLFKNFPGFVIEGHQQTWGTLCVFSNPDFDSEGTMWIMYGNPFESGGKHAKAQLKYMKPADRKAFYEADISSYEGLKGWTTIEISPNLFPSWNSFLLCGKHPKNKNKVFAFLTGEFNTLIIMDHHGNPEDVENIDLQTVTHLKNDHGWQSKIRYLSSVAEDPHTGEIIITGMDGLFIFDPSAPVVDGVGRGDHLSLRGGVPGDIVPTEGHIYKVIFDDEGRMWIGTRNLGVVGVNKERTEVIARYNTNNSPIPSDWVVGLGWNPETRSLMISTDHGLAEISPDLSSETAGALLPYLSVTAVSPDYNGTVEIRNVTPGEAVVIRDIEGNEIKRISTAESTTAEWDFKNAKGERVPSGHYTIKAGRNLPLSISVLR